MSRHVQSASIGFSVLILPRAFGDPHEDYMQGEALLNQTDQHERPGRTLHAHPPLVDQGRLSGIIPQAQ